MQKPPMTADNTRNYIRGVLRLFNSMDNDQDESEEADALREKMVEPWYALSDVERRRMDGLAMDLFELQALRAMNADPAVREIDSCSDESRVREYEQLKDEGNFDRALEFLRQRKADFAPHQLWKYRGDCWYLIGVPEVAVEFYREVMPEQ
jgi:hypothetical protein